MLDVRSHGHGEIAFGALQASLDLALRAVRRLLQLEGRAPRTRRTARCFVWRKPTVIEDARVALDDGASLDADPVVMGVGVRPITDLAEQAGTERGPGVVVDAFLESRAPASSPRETTHAFRTRSPAPVQCASIT